MTDEERREAREWYGALVVAKDEIANLKAENERLRRMLAFAWSMRRRTDCDCEHCEEVHTALEVRK